MSLTPRTETNTVKLCSHLWWGKPVYPSLIFLPLFSIPKRFSEMFPHWVPANPRKRIGYYHPNSSWSKRLRVYSNFVRLKWLDYTSLSPPIKQYHHFHFRNQGQSEQSNLLKISVSEFRLCASDFRCCLYHSPNFHMHLSLSDLFILFPWSVCACAGTTLWKLH